jgi:signal transduction histidine kinase
VTSAGLTAEASPRLGAVSVSAPGPATERLTRILYFAIGAAGIIFGALSIEPFRLQLFGGDAVGSVVYWCVLISPPVLLCALSHLSSMRVLRALAITEAVVFVVGLLIWFIWRATPLPAHSDIPWILSITAIPVVCVAIVARREIAWSYMLLVCAMSGVLRAITTTYDMPILIGIEDALYALVLQCTFVGLTLLTRRSAAALDAASRIAAVEVARRAARLGRRQERLRIDALVHDSVLSTLLIAGRGQAQADVISRSAARTLDQLDDFRVTSPTGAVPISELEWRLKSLAATVAPDASFRSEVANELALPAPVVAALLGSVGEALRNSAAHAGTEHVVSRELLVRGVDGGVQVVVRDDGVGFDPTDVPGNRLGVSQSIIGRMEGLAGGQAWVSSAPGGGVEVVVSWSR